MIKYEVEISNMDESMAALNKVPEGKTAEVRALLLTGAMRRRLQDIGLIEGTTIECLQKAQRVTPWHT